MKRGVALLPVVVLIGCATHDASVAVPDAQTAIAIALKACGNLETPVSESAILADGVWSVELVYDDGNKENPAVGGTRTNISASTGRAGECEFWVS